MNTKQPHFYASVNVYAKAKTHESIKLPERPKKSRLPPIQKMPRKLVYKYYEESPILLEVRAIQKYKRYIYDKTKHDVKRNLLDLFDGVSSKSIKQNTKTITLSQYNLRRKHI